MTSKRSLELAEAILQLCHEHVPTPKIPITTKEVVHLIDEITAGGLLGTLAALTCVCRISAEEAEHVVEGCNIHIRTIVSAFVLANEMPDGEKTS